MNPKYRKMLSGMQERENSLAPRLKRDRAGKEWFLYILKCNDGTFYTGITTDLKRRFKMHSDGKASRYTRTRRPLTLSYQEICRSRTHAMIKECTVKLLPRAKKIEMIRMFKNSKRITAKAADK